MCKTTTARKAQAVLAIFLMVIAYGLPSGLHLKFCVGEDGHWDISVIACASDQQTPDSSPPKTDPIGHHRGCTDFSTDCNGNNVCIPDVVPLIQQVSSKAFQLTSQSDKSAIVTIPINKTPAFFSSAETSFPHPIYLRTVVLLI